MHILANTITEKWLNTSPFSENFSIINHWSNHPLIVQDSSIKLEMS